MRSALKSLFATNPAANFKGYVRSCLSVFKAITREGAIAQGTVLHGHLIKTGTSSERYLSVKLLIMYLTCRKPAEAHEVTKEFDGFDLIVHNCLINANVQWGNLDEARTLFDEMPERNEVSWTTLISGLMKFGRVKESLWYFRRNPFQGVVSRTAVISGFVQNGLMSEALSMFLELYESGVRPNEVTITSVLKACSEAGDFRLGMSVLGLTVKTRLEHTLSVSNSLITLFLRMGDIDMSRRVFDSMANRDVVSWTAILDMYVKIGDLVEARRIFDEMPERNQVSWSAMIARYSQSGHPEEALKLFHEMIQQGFKPNVSCLSTVISALSSIKALQVGMNIHGHIVKIGVDRDVYISSSLVDLYCKCGQPNNGRLLFDSIPEKNVVTWNSMVAGYGLNEQIEEANLLFDIMPSRNSISWSALIAGYLDHKQFDKVFELFNQMLLMGEHPNKSTFSSLLCACASTASLEKGKDLHGKTIKLAIQSDLFVGTALTDMYAKSGDIQSACRIFNRMTEKNEFSWTVMIQGLAESGFAEESLNLFEEMGRSSSTPPNELMLSSVLFACSHSGLIDKGLEYFRSMERIYGVKLNGSHYTCVIDMLSRAGRLDEAEELVNSMPVQPEPHALAALLSGCQKHKNEELAERIAAKLWQMAETDSGGYVMLSNIYASAGRWKDVLRVRKLMNEKGLKKNGGYSWIELKSQVHSFYSGDGAHSESVEIHGMLDLLMYDMLLV
ncbi:Pentatricopeptide repeat-containing protein At2g13600 [Linum perenne]